MDPVNELQGDPSHLRALARLLWSGLGASERSGPAGVPKRKPAVEWRGNPPQARKLSAYLAVTNGESILRGSAGAVLLPPIYPVLWETALALDLLAQIPNVQPLGGLIHLGSERLQIRPLRADDRIRCRVELDRTEPCARGVRLTLVGRNWSESGQLCSQGELRMLVRVRSGGAAGGRSGQSREEPVPPASRELAAWTLRSDHGRRYARASGDYNPIHLWAWSARPFGFRRPILHGYCTEALVAHTLIGALWGGDPTALRRLQIRFRAPLLLPARVRLLIGEEEAGRGGFQVVGEGGGSGSRVYAEGSFTGG